MNFRILQGRLISQWANNFTQSWKNYSAADILSASSGVYSAYLGPLAEAGLAGKAAADASKFTDLGVGIPASAPGILSGATNGFSGVMREVGAFALGQSAGWGAQAFTEVVIVAALPEVMAAAIVPVVGVAASIAAAYSVGKLVSSGVDTFNAWMQQASTSESEVTEDLGSGQSITINPDQSYAIVNQNAVTYYDPYGNVTAILPQGGNIGLITIDNETGNVSVNANGQVFSAQLGTRGDGSLTLNSGSSTATLSQDENGGVVLSNDSGAIFTIPSAVSGQLPTATSIDVNGNVQTTSISADGTSISSTVCDTYGNVLHTTNTTQSIDGSADSTIRDSQGRLEADLHQVPDQLGGTVTTETFYNVSTGVVTGSNVKDVTQNGDVTVQNFDASGILTSDSWAHTDGSNGSDQFGPNGSSGSATNADHTTSAYQDDGHGNRSTNNYDVNGNLTSLVEVEYQTDDKGNATKTTTTTNYDPNTGVELGHNVSTDDSHGDTSNSAVHSSRLSVRSRKRISWDKVFQALVQPMVPLRIKATESGYISNSR